MFPLEHGCPGEEPVLCIKNTFLEYEPQSSFGLFLRRNSVPVFFRPAATMLGSEEHTQLTCCPSMSIAPRINGCTQIKHATSCGMVLERMQSATGACSPSVLDSPRMNETASGERRPGSSTCSSACECSSSMQRKSHKKAAAKQSKASARRIQIEVLDECAAFGARGLRVCWPVDAQRLRTNDTQCVSPSFELLPGVSFRLVLEALSVGKRKERSKARSGFKSSQGRGTIQLKSEAGLSVGLPPVSFSLTIGKSRDRLQRQRGPVIRDFADGLLCGLPPNEAEWDFASAVASCSETFVVSLDIVPLV